MEQRNRTSGGDQHPTEARSNRDSLRNHVLPSRQHKNQLSGDPNRLDDNDKENNYPHRNNNHHNQGPLNNDPPSSNPCGGGGGGNPGSGGSGNDPNKNSSYLNADPQGNIPYGNLVATIQNELKQDQLPVWDGNKDTTIEYFWKIQQLAALEGDIPVALGYWLWKSLKENSRISMWFTTLLFSEQSKMRTHYLHYLKGIEDNYLG